MRDSTQLGWHEAVLLLALRDETGETLAGWWPYALGGACLAELLERGRVSIDQGRKSFVNVTNPAATRDAALDECLALIRDAKRRAQAPAWITRFGNRRTLRHTVARALCARGVLAEDEARVLLFFRKKVYPEINPNPERDLLRRLNDIALNSARRDDPWATRLVAIAQAGELLKRAMDKRDFKSARGRLDAMMEADPVAAFTHKAVEAAAAAVTAAAVSGSVAATG
ncbi:MAG: GPP34 family phosphoprotein [Phycisphaeraceae bacterium]|nr:GPP34 family phosphoprotein [Phycisphaeraceae bacterium]